MNLYRIEAEIMRLVNPETGEIEDLEQLEKLDIERGRKIENIALMIKNLTAQAGAIEAEMNALNRRKTSAEAGIKRLKTYLETALAGQAFETSKVKISYTKSSETVVDEGFVEWAERQQKALLRYKSEPDKTAIKEAIMKGCEVRFARISEKRNMQIK